MLQSCMYAEHETPIGANLVVSRPVPQDVLFHSDQGCQYTSLKFRNEALIHDLGEV